MGSVATSGSGATTGTSGAGGSGTAGKSGSGGSGPSGGAGGAVATGGTLTGTLGALGAVKPVMNGWATTNGFETLIYLSSAPLTCAMMMTQGVKWLQSLPAGSQVIEIVDVTTTPAVGTVQVMPLQGEVNYAEGSKSSMTEKSATAGTIMFTKVEAKKVFEGTLNVTAPYTLMGTFHAEWCEGGTEY